MDNSIFQLKQNLTQPIVMIGLMGCGKSQIGRKLAHKLKWKFFDSDDCIVQSEGRSIPEIFEEKGEPYFRAVEAKTIAHLLNTPRCIIATGGGAIMTPETEQKIKQKAISVWLDTDITILAKRVAEDQNRPLLHGVDPAVRLKELYKERKTTYARANLRIEAEGSKDEVLQNVVSSLNTYLG